MSYGATGPNNSFGNSLAGAVRVKMVVACLMQRAEFYEGSRSLP